MASRSPGNRHTLQLPTPRQRLLGNVNDEDISYKKEQQRQEQNSFYFPRIEYFYPFLFQIKQELLVRGFSSQELSPYTNATQVVSFHIKSNRGDRSQASRSCGFHCFLWLQLQPLGMFHILMEKQTSKVWLDFTSCL